MNVLDAISYTVNHFPKVTLRTMNVHIYNSCQLNMGMCSVSGFFMAFRKLDAPIIHTGT
jgi:ABC-type glucose/galactose transport system permease subunit